MYLTYYDQIVDILRSFCPIVIYLIFSERNIGLLQTQKTNSWKLGLCLPTSFSLQSVSPTNWQSAVGGQAEDWAWQDIAITSPSQTDREGERPIRGHLEAVRKLSAVASSYSSWNHRIQFLLFSNTYVLITWKSGNERNRM